MIKIQDGELIDMMPSQLKYDTDMICLSHAIKCGIDKVLQYERWSMTINFIDELPEKILDVLAVELRSPYYTEDMDVETKRSIIKSTLEWYQHAGTVAAVEELIITVFGDGEVVEWWDIEDAVPGEFEVIADYDAENPGDTLDYFNRVIGEIKNTRSHLRRIESVRTLDGPIAGAGLLQDYSMITIRRE